MSEEYTPEISKCPPVTVDANGGWVPLTVQEPQISKCYEPAPEGEIKVETTIELEGEVKEPEVAVCYVEAPQPEIAVCYFQPPKEENQ